jgi:hypothetical protein
MYDAVAKTQTQTALARLSPVSWLFHLAVYCGLMQHESAKEERC